jgi:hypothetical protein
MTIFYPIQIHQYKSRIRKAIPNIAICFQGPGRGPSSLFLGSISLGLAPNVRYPWGRQAHIYDQPKQAIGSDAVWAGDF